MHALRALRVGSCLIDGELVVCDEAGMSSFERLRSRQHDDIAFLYAFDLLALDEQDMRPKPWKPAKPPSRAYCGSRRQAFRYASTWKVMANLYSGTRARWASKASSRSGGTVAIRHAELGQEREPPQPGCTAGSERGLGEIARRSFRTPANRGLVGLLGSVAITRPGCGRTSS
jgi:hypothetical protein